MNRLWVRLSLAISGIFLALIVLPATVCLVAGLLFSSQIKEGNMDHFNHFERSEQPDSPTFRFNGESRFTGPDRGLIFLVPPLILQGIFFIGLIGIIAGVLVSRGLTRPISELAEAAKSIGRGNLDHRVRVRGSREMVDLAQSFNQMATDLEQAESLRRHLMADVSHELRTPLTVLEGNLRAALDQVYELDGETLANLYAQTDHLIHLVDDLHELALAEARKLPLDLVTTDTGRLITETLAVFAPLAEEKGTHLSAHLPDTPMHITADCARLRQVLHNLLSNALRHTPAEGSVRITAETQGGYLTIRITDTGEGIDPAQIPHVFDRFYRTDRSRSRDTGGTGLGLAIVKAIVEAHGGQVSVHSPGLGHGSTFVVRLPVTGWVSHPFSK